jgi:hypothetical protein
MISVAALVFWAVVVTAVVLVVRHEMCAHRNEAPPGSRSPGGAGFTCGRYAEIEREFLRGLELRRRQRRRGGGERAAPHAVLIDPLSDDECSHTASDKAGNHARVARGIWCTVKEQR